MQSVLVIYCFICTFRIIYCVILKSLQTSAWAPGGYAKDAASGELVEVEKLRRLAVSVDTLYRDAPSLFFERLLGGAILLAPLRLRVTPRAWRAEGVSGELRYQHGLLSEGAEVFKLHIESSLTTPRSGIKLI